jgi:uncharacterized protein
MIGREEQLEQINILLKSNKSEFVSVLGRRRIGKTYLIDQAFKEMICFQLTGIQMANTEVQLDNFNKKLFFYSKAKYISTAPNNWADAFFQLKSYLDTLSKKQKQVIVLDELPWIFTVKSGFLQQLAHLWNDYLSKHQHFILVVCGSASSWIAKNITNNKGGLHNRLTQTIEVKPFTLQETELFLASKKIKLSHQDITKIYMAIGGIPYYLDDIRRGENSTLAIERMCFKDGGKLKIEYDNLYKAIFNHANEHEKIVEALAGSQKGMLRSQIIAKSKVKDGGPFNRTMNELLTCGFIVTINQFGQKKRDEVYRLNDEYTAFYHRFIKPQKKYSEGMWLQQAETQAYKIWLGFAFELLVFRHIDLVKRKLSIAGVYSEVSTYYNNTGKSNGLQIDLLIDRKDNTINYCEIKFHETTFSIDKAFFHHTQAKIDQFKVMSKTKKQIFVTLITNHATKENDYSIELIDSKVVLDDLF